MKNENINLYFETSAINYLLDHVFSEPRNSSIETKKLQISKKRRWYISTVTLWEIFLTKHEERRYQLFDFSRCLFYDFLISTPEEIIINYIKSGCPGTEKRHELISSSLFSKEWTLACKDLNYAFQPDRSQVEEMTDHLRFLSDYFIKTPKGFKLQSFNNLDKVSNKLDWTFLQHIFNSLMKLYRYPPTDKEKYLLGITLQVTLIIICYGIGFDHLTIENFWNKDRKTEPLERLEYILKNFPDVFFRGPITNIAKMIFLQSQTKTGRGLYFDSLHTTYVTYSDLYVTNDGHFLDFKKANKQDSNMSKVIDVKEMKFFMA